MRRALAIVLSLCAAQAAAEAPRLSLPIDCVPGQSCYVQNYVDRDPGPGAADFACGHLSYDGHKGTDFALPSLTAMQAGVDVRAAAAGTVLGTRDAMPDIAIDAPDAPDLDGRDCGNGVLIDHGDGWQTQYCHMRRGSIRVARGQTVDTGAILGQVGLSGRTQFPHLHLSLRRNGEIVDPFRPDDAAGCDTGGPTALWQEAVTYAPGGIIAAGFSPALPDYGAIKAGDAGATDLTTEAGALVLWGFVFGARAGDRIEFRIESPAGELLNQAATLDRTQARLFRAAGKRRSRPWATGIYQGTVTLIRDGRVIDSRSATVGMRE